MWWHANLCTLLLLKRLSFVTTPSVVCLILFITLIDMDDATSCRHRAAAPIVLHNNVTVVLSTLTLCCSMIWKDLWNIVLLCAAYFCVEYCYVQNGIELTLSNISVFKCHRIWDLECLQTSGT
jgi:hypothetical protein